MATKGIALREWLLSRSEYDTDGDFRQAVVNELAAFEHVGERLGIGLTASPARMNEGGHWVTKGWVFRTHTVPAIVGNQPLSDVEPADPDPLYSEGSREDDAALIEDPDLAPVE